MASCWEVFLLKRPPDLIMVGNGGMGMVEDKNGRGWMAPWSHEVWELIGKALRHDAIPVLVCRKILYPLFLLFKQIGGLGFQMHGQVFPEDFQEQLERVKHRDGLGFADIRFGDHPPPALVRFLSATVPDQLAEKLATFRARKELLAEFAINRELEEDELGSGRRAALYQEFYRELQRGEADTGADEWGVGLRMVPTGGEPRVRRAVGGEAGPRAAPPTFRRKTAGTGALASSSRSPRSTPPHSSRRRRSR